LGQEQKLGPYTFTFRNLYKGESADYSYQEAALAVSGGGWSEPLSLERRKYRKYAHSIARAGTLFTLGSQPFASLLGVDEKAGAIKIHLSVNPQITWIWIGGALLCLGPLINLARSGRKSRASRATGHA
jgi:cytochrome c-type biogenesis protein CcmF